MNYNILRAFDYNIFEIINGLVGKSGFLDSIMVFIASYGPLVFDAYIVFLWFRGKSEEERENNRRRALYVAFSALVALGINQVFGFLWFRERPYVHHPVKMLLPYSPDPSFPSDHAAGGFSIATAVLFGQRLPGVVLLIFAFILAISRVYVGLHYPSDVAGGAVFGILGAIIVEQCKGLLERPIHTILLIWKWIERKLPFIKAIRI